MAMGEGRGLDISINPHEKNGRQKTANREVADDSKISQLFASLGAEGKIKVYRIVQEGVHIGKHAYCTTLQVDEAITDNLEDAIGRALGGGDFYLKGWEKGRAMGLGVSIYVDETNYLPKKSARENAREGIVVAAPIDNSNAALAVERLREEMKLEQMKMQQNAEARQQQFVGLMLTIMENNATRSVEMVKAMAMSSSHGGSGGDGIGQITKVADLLRTMGWSPGEGGGGGSNSPEMGPAMHMLNSAVQTFAGKISDKVADAVGKTMTQPPAPQPQPRMLPTPQLAPPVYRATTEADRAKQEILVKPVASEIRLPPGVKMIDPKDAAQRRATHRQAPPVHEAIPETKS
jgi:hypothetical protein